ncbi:MULTISPECIES: CesT family type III secretion system chaperone [unclassified Brenneria]|uniref:CesT family type III secretion system chaperone n=1 Tax=unclassified Brenneria TaxID=2634434 RepID=UPI0018F07D3F|nr:CesT family type III secretion system chaperone [Brenneria sp. L3-3C-1]MBJ7221839.1 CesT family type III secretion system chaperone [Brenneria sp. L3-3C-1]MEE3643082.1 CesT family type III secretion system chaperone [Brenneria sp. L3_3C_1]
MNKRAFHIVMSRLMKSYDIDTTKAAQSGHDVYIMTLEDGTSIFLMGNQQEYLNIMSPFASLEQGINTASGTLLSLLAINAWSPRHPMFTLGVDIHKMKIILSCRQALAELNDSETHKLVRTFIETVLTLQTWLRR